VTPLVFVAVALVGGFGAVARLVLDDAVSGAVGRAFPFGTLAVNVIGALTLGVLAGAALSKGAYEIAGIGLVGAFTTFSTWAFESHRLGEDGRLRLGLLNFVLSLIVGVAAVWAGRHLGATL
jgi:CrcB protein